MKHFIKKTKKSIGTKNKLYCERSQSNRYAIFQVISAVVRIYLLYILKRMVITLVLNVKRCFNTKKETFSSVLWDSDLMKL